MSTSYGFKCRECDKIEIVGNARSSLVPTFQQILLNLESIKKVRAIDSLLVQLDGGGYNFDAAILLAIEHTDLGHTILIVDEYGREWNQCHHHVCCPHCDDVRPCALKEKHEGGCKSATDLDRERRRGGR